MALNMEEVAKGDFTRRMGVGNEDEVGRLIEQLRFDAALASLRRARVRAGGIAA